MSLKLFSSKSKSTNENLNKKNNQKKENIKINKINTNKTKTFTNIGIKDWLIKSLNNLEIRKPTDVQVF